MTEETWKSIPDWEEYEVSTIGRVRKVECGTFVAQVLTGKPQYFYCNLGKAPNRKLMRVHRLVALAHIPNPDNLPVVDHIDRNPYHNHIDNLRWICRKGNQRNMKSNITLPCGTPLISAIERDYGSLDLYLYRKVLGSIKDGLPYEKAYTAAIQDRLDYEDYGRKFTKVLWGDKEVHLARLCKQYGKNYTKVRNKISNGWDVWNALHDCPPEYKDSVEYDSIWFPNKDSLREYVGAGKGVGIGQIINGEWKRPEPNRYTILFNNRELTGTKDELSSLTGLSYDGIGHRIRKGHKPITRVRKYNINGSVKSRKEWCDDYGVCPRTLGKYMSRKKCTFRQALKYYGVNVHNLKITPLG